MSLDECRVCGEELSSELKACPVCGTSTEASMPPHEPTATVDIAVDLEVEASPIDGEKLTNSCHACGANIAEDYDDEFCVCGAQLPPEDVRRAASQTSGEPVAPATLNPVPQGAIRPPKGTFFLTLFSSEKQPIAYFPIKGDFTLVGRSDPIRGDFPDADISQYFEPNVSKKVSRRHLLIIRARDSQRFFVRALAKSTGTQVESALLEELQDYPITPGTRMVLGGTVRLKFEHEE